MKWLKNEEIKMMELLKKGYSYSEISSELNRTSRSVKEKINDLGYNSKSFIIPKRDIECLNCSKKFEVSIGDKRDSERKFCSKSCSATYNNKHKTKKPSVKIKKNLKLEKPNCIICGEKVKKINYIYCSNKCQMEHKYRNFIQKWREGEKDGKRGDGVSRTIRRYLFEKFDNKCTRCGWTEKNIFTNKIPLEVEHVDGNSNNNNESNLTLLCPNCHSLTKTYKGGNKGFGRYNRRIRYNKGKSY